MKKVNEKRWALVMKSDGEVQDVGSKEYIEHLGEIHSNWCRLARVQITEIEEESDGQE